MSATGRPTPAAEPHVVALPAWVVILRMVRYRPGLWLGNLAAMLTLILFWQMPGLVMRQFFDLLTGEASAGLNVWSIVALLCAFELGRLLGIYGLISTNVPFFANTMTLLRKNLLRQILRRPGASALPDSPGEAISRFRGDVFEISLFALWLNDITGMIAFGVVAIVVMVGISPSITGLAILPLSLFDSIRAIRRLKPHAALGVGGYVSGPSIMAAWLFRVPCAIQEQNAAPGITRFLAAYQLWCGQSSFPT